MKGRRKFGPGTLLKSSKAKNDSVKNSLMDDRSNYFNRTDSKSGQEVGPGEVSANVSRAGSCACVPPVGLLAGGLPREPITVVLTTVFSYKLICKLNTCQWKFFMGKPEKFL